LIRNNWSRDEIQQLFQIPFMDLLFAAQTVHRQFFEPNCIQISTSLSIKTGACHEDCEYCPQSGHYNTGLEEQKLLKVEKVISQAIAALAGLDYYHRNLNTSPEYYAEIITKRTYQGRLDTLSHVRDAGKWCKTVCRSPANA